MKNTKIEKMECNGYAYFNDENFENNHDLPCYIPENAKNENDIYTRNDLKIIIENWLNKKETLEYLSETYENEMPAINDEFINDWVCNMYENIEWTFPQTWLDEITK